MLLKIADIIENNLDRLAKIETVDNGKAVRETMAADLPLVVDHFRYFAGVIRAEEGSASEIDGDTLSLCIQEPLGVSSICSSILLTHSLDYVLTFHSLYNPLFYRYFPYRHLPYRHLLYRHLLYCHLPYCHLPYCHLLYRHFLYRHRVYRHLLYRHFLYRHRVYLHLLYRHLLYQHPD